MEFNLLLFEGTDLIKFGMTSEEIQSILNVEPERFKKTEFDLYDTEDYDGFCHVFFEAKADGTLVCAGIEFFKPSKVFFEGIQLIGTKRETVESIFKIRFEDCMSDSDGVSSKEHDIAFFAPKKTIQSVYIARKGYSAEQDEYYKKAFEEKYQVEEDEVQGVNVRMRLCPKCMNMMKAEEGFKCPSCDVPMI